FSISSITLARKLERTAAGSTSARKVPFVLGNLRVIPRPGEMFRKAEEFAFYYQIYNALRDGATQRVDVDVSYRFFRRPAGLDGEPFQALGEPMTLNHLREEVLGFSFPLRDWPEADYRLLVTVRDNLSGERAEGTAHFRVR
ncbi:MAG: hypothetical protein HY509_02105, partial [Acidobacteria bacterium]|nr:hypothetical protein [Acidobacteriota bacterium]